MNSKTQRLILIGIILGISASSILEYVFFSRDISYLREKIEEMNLEIKECEKTFQTIDSKTPLAEENLTKLIEITPKIVSISSSLSGENLLENLQNYTKWVHDHIKYNYDSEYPYIIGGKVYFKADVWSNSSDTLERGYGDCEDMAILVASLFRARYPKEDVFIIVISMGNVSHAAVLIPELRAIADPTFGEVFYGKNFLFSWYSAISAPQGTYVRFIVGYFREKPYYYLFSSNLSFLSWLKENYGD